MAEHTPDPRELANHYGFYSDERGLLAGALKRALDERDRLAADVEASAKAFSVPLPEPGSDMAKVMAVNRRLLAGRDRLHEALARAHGEPEGAT